MATDKNKQVASTAAVEAIAAGIDAQNRILVQMLKGGSTVEEMSFADLQAVIRSRSMSSVLNIGDQLNFDFNWNGKATSLPYDAGHFFDGSDADHPLVTTSGGEQVPALCLLSHRTLPVDTPFEQKQAIYAAQADMKPGTYSFDVKVTGAWGTGAMKTVGTKTYTFTTTKDIPAGSQFMWNASYNTAFTSLSIYKKFSTELIETVAVTEGTGGTALGTATEVGSTDGFNNLQRACEGSNRWATSALRAWLNSDSTDWDTCRTPWTRPHALNGKPGALACLPEGLVSMILECEHKTEEHACDGGEIATTYDKLYPISAREHYFNNYLSATSAGFAAEGVQLDYWKNLAAAHGRTSPWAGWGTYPELITYAGENPTVARIVFGRSAVRTLAYANYPEYVNGSGGVGSTGANYSHRVPPALLIG